MLRAKKILAVGLILPIVILIGITANLKYTIEHGKEVILPISGYDPRSLLQGYYLMYTVDYGITDICKNEHFHSEQKAYVCLEPKQFSYSQPENCAILIQGTCQYRTFKAGVERFYASQQNAQQLEKLVRNHSASVALAVTKSGQAFVKYLLVDGKRWEAN